MDLRVHIGSSTLPNPLGVASGTFGCGEEYAPLTDLKNLGALYTKAVTLEPREGNPPPRLAETPAGMINSIGLANGGLKDFLANKIPFLQTLPCPVILNVAGSQEGDYQKLIAEVDAQEVIWGYEINISCPNVKKGGLAFGLDPAQVESLTAALRKETRKPLIMKLSPNVTDISAIAQAAEQGGADALSCVNTVIGMAVDIQTKRPSIPALLGGLSGPAIKPIGLAAVWRTSQKVGIPVIGLGGIATWQDGVEYLLAGASALQIGTANFIDPHSPQKVLEGIRTYMEREGFQSLRDFHGHF